MHISVAKYGGAGDLLTVEIGSDLTIIDLKAVIESESDFQIKANEMNLYYDGKLLDDEKQTLEQYNLKDYDIVTCQRTQSNTDLSQARSTRMNPSTNPNSPEQLLNELRSNPEILERFRHGAPELADIIQRGDTDAFVRYMMSRRGPRGMRPPPELDLLDPRTQERIEQSINMENVMDNMEHAYEYAPEVFGNVVMLYVNCKVNSHPVKAFVDSGAQMTIMSKACAERCGIMRLIDRNFSGIAKGVGTQRILGRIHLAQLEVEKQYFATSLSILEDQSIDMLIGLDMLRRHRCVIDLDKNVLRIENSVETTFLPESELPQYARLTGNSPGLAGDEQADALLRSTAESANNHRQPQPSTRPAAASAAATLTPSPFPETTVKEITKRGFTREQAIEELKLTNGDGTKALVSLMAKSLSKPKQKK